MSFTEEELRRAAQQKQRIEARIAELEAEIADLRETLVVIDSILRRASFRSAAEIVPEVVTVPTETAPPRAAIEPTEFRETRPITTAKDGPLVANAYISPRAVAIIPTTDTHLGVDIPPFRSFFLGRILDGMRSKDMEAAQRGELNSTDVLQYTVEEDDGRVKKILVLNYRDQRRLTEILNTAAWAFRRMLEKQP